MALVMRLVWASPNMCPNWCTITFTDISRYRYNIIYNIHLQQLGVHAKGGPVGKQGEGVLVGPGLVAVQEDGHLGPRLPGPGGRPGDLLRAVHARQTLPAVVILYAGERMLQVLKFTKISLEPADTSKQGCWE